MKNRIPRALSMLLALMMVFGIIAPGLSGNIYAAGVEEGSASSITEFSVEQLKAFETVSRLSRPSGLIGFEEQYSLPDNGSGGNVSVIVEFKCQPAIMQQIEAQMFGNEIPSDIEAARLAENEHQLFRKELDELFGITPPSSAYQTGAYRISAEYTDAINGVALTLPADMVAKLVEFESVWAVYPDVKIMASPEVHAYNESTTPGLEESRQLLDLEALHSQGITGENVVVGVLDTGVDYNHPDLAGAFSDTIKEGSDLQPINGLYYGRNYVEDVDGLEQRAFNDPMETTYAEWESVRDIHIEVDSGREFYTSHGTHVAGTIAARGTNEPVSAIGMAPGATLLAYRVLGVYGAGMSSWLLSAMDDAHKDGCTVLNASLGVDLNDPRYISCVAANNLVLQHDIVFVVAGGNAGPTVGSLGAPGASAMTITVGNGTAYLSIFTLKAKASVTEIDLSLIINSHGASFEKVNEDGGYIIKNPNLYPDDKKTDDVYKLVPLKNVNSDKPLVIDLPSYVNPTADTQTSTEQQDGNTVDEPLPQPDEDPVDDTLPDPDEDPVDDTLPDPDEDPVDDTLPDPDEDPVDDTLPEPEENVTEAYTSQQDGEPAEEALPEQDESPIEEPVPEQDEGTAEEQQPAAEEADDELTPSGSFDDDPNELVIGVGTREEFEALKDEISGSIVIVYRGQLFNDTIGLAVEYGAHGLLVINNGNEVITYQGEAANTVPVAMTLTTEDGVDLVVSSIVLNNGNMSFTAFDRDIAPGKTLADSSSRGPVSGTADIKPDIVAPGTLVLSTVPFYITTKGSKSTIDGDSYVNAYQRMSGTSMASPHVAGMAALLRGCNAKWTAAEVKARLMNTASLMNGNYSVHESGAGYVNPVAAVGAKAVVTVDCHNVFMPDNRPTVTAQTAAFNFSGLYLDQPTEQSSKLNAKIANSDDVAKTYSITIEKNHTGFLRTDQKHLIASSEMWINSGVSIDLSSSELNVDAHGEAVFSMALNLPAETDKSYAGIYEGFVILTNVNDNAEEYRLPFSLILRNEVEVGLTFISHPVINTKAVTVTNSDGYYYFSIDSTVVHARNSCFANIVTTVFAPVESITFAVAHTDIENIGDPGEWIGMVPATVRAEYVKPGSTQFWENQLMPVYWEYANGSMTGQLKKFDAGQYTIIACYDSGFGVTYREMDLLVEDDIPQLTIDGLKDDNCNYSGNDISVATITGNIFDEGLDEMAKKGILFEMYDDEGDIHGPVPDQALNAIFARAIGGNGEFYQATVEPDGRYSLTIAGLSLTGVTEVELYYLDSFAAAVAGESTISDGFDPNAPSFANFYGPPYGFYGINKGHKIITLSHTGPCMMLDKKAASVDTGDIVKLNAIFNEDAIAAGYSKAAAFKTSDANVATVAADGTVTAVGWGTAVITAVSNIPAGLEALEATMVITVTGVNDGVHIPIGSQVWFGRYEYIDFDVNNPVDSRKTDFKAKIADKPYITDNVDVNRPMHWRVMGEEVRNGKGDRYVTLFSGAAIDIVDYNAGGWKPYASSDLRRFLNNDFMDKAFTVAENDAVPHFDVAVGRYDIKGNSIGRDVLEDQRVYIPWGIDVKSAAKYANSVFWTAGDEMTFENSLRGGSAVKNLVSYRNISGKWLATYYLRTQDETSGVQKVVNGSSNGGRVESRENTGFFSEGLEWNDVHRFFMACNFGVGVVPVTKLDIGRVVFAYEQLIGDPDITDGGLGWKTQFTSAQDPHLCLRLAILGGNNGLDIGTLSNIPSSHQVIEEGQQVRLSQVRASNSGEGYSIGYKVVGDVDGARKIINCGTFAVNANQNDMALHTGKLAPGEYKVYVWLQKDNDYSSIETGVVESFKLTVKKVEFADGVNDGVALPIGSYVYYGSYNHAMDADSETDDDGVPIDAPVKQREAKATPILWQILGEEIDKDGNGDGYTTMMSRYVLDRWIYSPKSNPLVSYGFEFYRTQTGYDLVHKFPNSFTGAEYNQIPFITVDRCDYFIDEPTFPVQSSEREKVYLPWITRSYLTDDPQSPGQSSLRSVLWSAGHLPYEENALAWKYNAKNEEIPEEVKGAFKNGTPSGYWAGNSFSCYEEYMHSSGKTHEEGWLFYYSPYYHGGLRPVTKLDPRGIIYAAKAGTGFIPDGTNYLNPGKGEEYYKLTVQGQNGGRSVGTLGNISGSTINLRTGTILKMPSVTSSAFGSDFRIAYKIVGGEEGSRKIERYGEFGTSNAAQDLALDTGLLPAGRYMLYIWLQKNNDTASNEAGVVYSAQLNVGEIEYTVEYRHNDAQGKLLHTYTGMCTDGERVTADSKTFSGYLERPGQTKAITAVKGQKNLIVVVYDKLASYTVEYRVTSRTGTLLYSYNGEGLVGSKLTAETKTFKGYREISGQSKEITLVDGKNVLVVLFAKHKGGDVTEPDPVVPTPGTTAKPEEQIPSEPPALAGGDVLLEADADGNDTVVYYYDAAGNKVYVAFSVVIGKKIYYVGNKANTYYTGKNPKQFIDIAGNWAKDDILFVAQRGIVNGMTETEYQPQGTLTRAMLVAVLARMADADVSGYTTTGFADSNGSWYTPYIAWAADEGIITGYADGAFRPNRAVSREEIAAMVVRFIDSLDIELDINPASKQFADRDQIQAWAADAVERMRQYGILSGRGDNRFDPKANATRAETAKIIRVLIESAMDRMVASNTAATSED